MNRSEWVWSRNISIERLSYRFDVTWGLLVWEVGMIQDFLTSLLLEVVCVLMSSLLTGNIKS